MVIFPEIFVVFDNGRSRFRYFVGVLVGINWLSQVVVLYFSQKMYSIFSG